MQEINVLFNVNSPSLQSGGGDVGLSTNNESVYQYTNDVLIASWEYRDDDTITENVHDNIADTWYSVGSFPGSDDIKPITNLDLMPNLVATVLPGDVTPVDKGLYFG